MKRNENPESEKAGRVRSDYNSGLCATCRNSTVCTYVSPDEVAVIFCEEFDTAARESNPSRPDARSVLQRAAAIVEAEKDTLLASKNLCINCATSGECIYSHSGDNRWYCEEYS